MISTIGLAHVYKIYGYDIKGNKSKYKYHILNYLIFIIR